jgi:hypothetical protein
MGAGRDDLTSSFYLHIMRASIGAVLRAEPVLDEPLPDRLAELLNELEKELDGPMEASPIRTDTDNAS